MVLKDAAWAKVGKVVTFLGAAIALIFTAMQLVDRFSGPRLVAVVSVSEQYVPPEIKEELRRSFDPESITKLIDAQKKRGKSAQEILRAVHERVSDKDFRESMFELQHGLGWSVLTVLIKNSGDDVAENVRLVLPGSGKVQMTEFSIMPRDQEPLEWKSEILVGAIRPGATVKVLVWPKDSFLWGTEHYQPSVIHSNGSGTVRWMRQFYGWDADLVAWYLAQLAFTRYVLVAFTLLLLGAGVWYATSRKHLVFSLRGTRSATGTNESP